MNDAKSRAAQNWYGYGRWTAPCWFVGMEPAGDERHPFYETWDGQFGGQELIDCKGHHLASGVRYLYEGRPKIQRTWGCLIHFLLGYKGDPAADVYAYQRDRWGSDQQIGETALVEISALRAKNLGTPQDRKAFRPARVKTIRERLIENKPEMVLFYGRTYRRIHESIIGLSFGDDDCVRLGDTLCVLVTSPTGRPNRSWQWWAAKGVEIRAMGRTP